MTNAGRKPSTDAQVQASELCSHREAASRFAQALVSLSFLLFCHAFLGGSISSAQPVTAELVPAEAPDTAFAATAQTPLPVGFPPANPATSPFPADTGLIPPASKAAGSMLFILGMILTATFLLKRYWPQRFGPAQGRRQIQVLETAALGDRQSLTLVRVGEATLLLARTPGTITLLERVESKPAAVEPAEDPVAALRQDRMFGESSSISSAKALLRFCKSGFARLGQVRVKMPQLAWLRHEKPPVPAPGRRVDSSPWSKPDFESVMRAELDNAHLLSRLSEIRSELARK